MHREVGYPAIDKAQRMSAARLGVAPHMARTGEEQVMQQRRVQDRDRTSAAGGREQGEGEAATAPSPWTCKRRDTLTSAVATAAAAAVGKRFGSGSSPPLRSHSKSNNPTGDSSRSQPGRSTTRRRKPGGTATTAGSSLTNRRRRSPAGRGRARAPGDTSGVSSGSTSRSVSPSRRVKDRETERGVSMEKTLAVIAEVRTNSAGICFSEHKSEHKYTREWLLYL